MVKTYGFPMVFRRFLNEKIQPSPVASPLDGSTPCAAATTGTLVLHLPRSAGQPASTASPDTDDTDTPRLGWRSGENVVCFNTCMHIVCIYIYIHTYFIYIYIHMYVYVSIQMNK